MAVAAEMVDIRMDDWPTPVATLEYKSRIKPIQSFELWDLSQVLQMYNIGAWPVFMGPWGHLQPQQTAGSPSLLQLRSLKMIE